MASPNVARKKGAVVKAMLQKHETPEHEQDLHLEPAVREGKKNLEAMLETQPDRKGLEARGILATTEQPQKASFSASDALKRIKGDMAVVGQAAPAAEASTVEQMREDTVASRVQDLYDKIRKDPDANKAVATVEGSASARVELADNLVTSGAARQDEIESRLKTLDKRFTKVQSIEAEKFKVLNMLINRVQEDAGVEKCSLDVIKERYDREVQSIESTILLDLNVHRQARRDLDKGITLQIDEKLGIFSAELAEERQDRQEAGTRIGLDPTIIPVLSSNIEQEGTLRYDRGEQLLEKIREKTVNLHNMLSVEEDAHSHIEEFTGQIEGRCGELRKSVEEEQEQRALIEQRHAQRMEDLKTLEADVGADRQKRERKRELVHSKIKDEMADFFKYVQAEQADRQKSEEYILRMCDDSTGKLEEEIKTERDNRESSEEHFFKLLEDTCQRARNNL